MSLSAMHRSVGGLVIDGAVRDSQATIDMDFPVFCRGASIKRTLKNQPGEIGQPIVLGGVIVVGDRDGLVIVSFELVGAVLESARQREPRRTPGENKLRVALRWSSGASGEESQGFRHAADMRGVEKSPANP
jgi:4-hydroxy-4-methyl-2-oxoglutarate aldolase